MFVFILVLVSAQRCRCVSTFECICDYAYVNCNVLVFECIQLCLWFDVHMWVCLYMRVLYICIEFICNVYAWLCVLKHEWMCHIYVSNVMYTCMCVEYVFVYVFERRYWYVWLCVHVFSHMCVCVWRDYVWTCIIVHFHVHMYVCVYTRMCAYIHLICMCKICGESFRVWIYVLKIVWGNFRVLKWHNLKLDVRASVNEKK